MKSTLRSFLVVACGVAGTAGLLSAADKPAASTRVATTAKAAVVGVAGGNAQDLVAWLKGKTPNYTHSLWVTMASNKGAGPVTYATGALTLNGQGTQLLTSSQGPYQAKQYFSDRLWAAGTGGGLSVPTNPFDPAKTDVIGATIDVASGNLTLKLAGNKTEQVALKWEKGVAYGFGGSTMYVLSFKKTKDAVIK